MKNKGFCVIRTKKGNIVNVYSIATLDFIENNKNRYDYNKSYLCDTFEILENIGGEVFIELYQKMKYSGVEIKTTIRFKNEIIEDIRIEDYIC
jgi:hypothetical protein